MVRYPSLRDRNLSKGFGEVLAYNNEVTNSWASNGLLISIWILLTTGVFLARRDFFEAIAVSGFSVFIISVLMWLGGFVSDVTVVFTLVISVVSFASLWISKTAFR